MSRAHELRGHLGRRALGELSPGVLGLVAAPLQSGHRLEVGVEHDDAFLADRIGDQRVQRLLAGASLPLVLLSLSCRTRNGIPVALQMRAKSGMFGLPPHDDRDRLPVDVVAECREHEREHELLGQALDENGRMGEEELAARGVELGHYPEVLVGGHGLRLEGVRPRGRKAFHEDELHARDVEERRGVCRVDDLIAGEGEIAQEAVALRLWAEKELRLLDQEQQTAEAFRSCRTRPRRERHAPVLPASGPGRSPLEDLGGGTFLVGVPAASTCRLALR